MKPLYRKIKLSLYKTLRWSQKYTKTDMIYLTKGMSWLSLGQVVSAGTSFLFAIAVANLLPKEVYGTYKFVLSIASILAIPTLAGINTAVIRAVARGHDGSLRQGVRARLRWGTLASLGALGVAGYYFLNGNIELTISMLIVATFMPIMESFATYQAFLNGKKRFDIHTRFNIVSQIVAYGVLIGAIFLTDNLFIILLAYFVPWTILQSTFFFITQRKFVENQSTEEETVSYGKHLSVMGIIGTVANHLDKILLFHFLGAAEVAIYAIAIAPPEQIKALVKTINPLALPKFSQRSRTEIKKSIGKKMTQLGWVILLISIAYILLTPFFFKALFPEYPESIFLSQVFALSLVFGVGILPSTALQALSAKKELYVFNVVQATIQIVLLVVFIYFFGLLGAVVARVLARMFNVIISWSLL